MPLTRHLAIVIPAYCELETLGATLEALLVSRKRVETSTQLIHVVVVVNHPHNADLKTREQSSSTLALLQDHRSEWCSGLHVLDRTQPGIENGVGEARKIGMDYAVTKLLAKTSDLLVCLDADTRVAENYFEVLMGHDFSGAGFTLRFEHPLQEAEDPQATALYELYLLYTQAQLARIGSPYAHFTIGSALGTSVAHYRLVGGMVSKPATEDFHFLNKLRKHGPIAFWPETCVYPQPRRSERVFLGTGFFLSGFKQDRDHAFAGLTLPSPQAFSTVEKILKILAEMSELKEVSNTFTSDFPTVHRFFKEKHLYTKLQRLKAHSGSETRYHRRVLEVFDGLHTFRLLRKLIECEPSPQVSTFLAWCHTLWPLPTSVPLGPETLLAEARSREIAPAFPETK